MEHTMRTELQKLIGVLPSESGFRKRMRFHQGWWRAFVLAEEQGAHPIRTSEPICNTILNGKISRKNFLSQHIFDAVAQTIHERQSAGSGILEEDRLFDNLLSSQPLCFNFFGELKIDTDFALQLLQRFYPEFTQVKQVIFEFAPIENYTNDNSAFDVAIEVMIGNRTGLLGLECKYTDTFSQKEYKKDEYLQIYERSGAFAKEYDIFISKRFNQLFRNQLIAEALIQNKKYDFVFTGLFCHQDDTSALETGSKFQSMLTNGNEIFQIITYQNFIENMQQLNLDWNKRELSMLLWARYCATRLSSETYKHI